MALGSPMKSDQVRDSGCNGRNHDGEKVPVECGISDLTSQS